MTVIPSLVRLVAAVGGICVAGHAAAGVVVSGLTPQVYVDVATRVDNQMANDQLATGGGLLFGASEASPLGATAKVREGEPWSHPCQQALCGSLSSQTAVAKGEINTDLARFKSLTGLGVLSAEGAGQTILGQTDVVTFSPAAALKTPQLKLHLDMDSSAGTSNETRGYSLFEFRVSLTRKACDTDLFPDGCDNQVFFFHGQDYAGTDIDSWSITGQDGAVLGEGVRLPMGGMDFTLDLFDLGGAALQIGVDYDLGIVSRSYSECAARTSGVPQDSCTTYMDASHTVYVGITGLETSTYRYPGFTPGDPPNGVPEPGSLPMVLTAFGLAALGTRRVQQRRR